jgi:hypothetical protein
MNRAATNSIFCGCTAKIIAIVDAFSMNKDVVKVTYHWQHVNHIPTSIGDVRRGPAHRAIKEFIQEQVDNNMSKRSHAFDANSFTDQNISAVNRIATEISNITSRLTDLSLNAQDGSQRHHQRQRRF